MVEIYDPRPCTLGEGPLWHPGRGQFFWFDIVGRRLMTREDGAPRDWGFDEHVSAAGWVDDATLLVASETALFAFDLETGRREDVAPLEAANPVTRSNDGRADPWGGFWIGTMGKNAEKKAGAIYRFYRGEVTLLYPGVSIPNAICFAPDRRCAYFADTPTKRIMQQALDEEGWPAGAPELFVDLAGEGLNPDGAVVDAAGCLWNAQWGAGRVARYAPDGTFLSAVSLPAKQTTCPAFGGPDLTRLLVTSAREGMAEPGPEDGATFAVEPETAGQAEHRVLLG